MEIDELKAPFILTSPYTPASLDLLEEGAEFKRDRCTIDSASEDTPPQAPCSASGPQLPFAAEPITAKHSLQCLVSSPPHTLILQLSDLLSLFSVSLWLPRAFTSQFQGDPPRSLSNTGF